MVLVPQARGGRTGIVEVVGCGRRIGSMACILEFLVLNFHGSFAARPGEKGRDGAGRPPPKHS